MRPFIGRHPNSARPRYKELVLLGGDLNTGDPAVLAISRFQVRPKRSSASSQAALRVVAEELATTPATWSTSGVSSQLDSLIGEAEEKESTR